MIRLLHASDLHIGHEPFWVRSFAPGGPRVAPWCPGEGGHDERVAESLASFWRLLRDTTVRAGNAARVLVTGDVTRSGHDAEFVCAWRLLHAQWTEDSGGVSLPLSGRLFGLGAGAIGRDAEVLAVPGSRDYWHRVLRTPVADPAHALRPHFWPLPWVYRILDPGSALELHVAGLDTMSGLWLRGARQAHGKGSIAPEQLARAAKLLQEAQAAARLRAERDPHLRVLRVAAMHHPMDELDQPEAMRRWFADQRIEVVLCGHTHRPDVDDARVPLQVVCGSTTQAAPAAARQAAHENHLFVHEVEFIQGAAPSWITHWWSHDGVAWRKVRTNPDAASSPLLRVISP